MTELSRAQWLEVGRALLADPNATDAEANQALLDLLAQLAATQ